MYIHKIYKFFQFSQHDIILTKIKIPICIGASISGVVLLIDDLFKGKLSESDINIVFEIINYRYLNFLPIIVSSEFNINRLLSFDEGVGSRIYEMCKDYVVEIEKDMNNNYRLK